MNLPYKIVITLTSGISIPEGEGGTCIQRLISCSSTKTWKKGFFFFFLFLFFIFMERHVPHRSCLRCKNSKNQEKGYVFQANKKFKNKTW